VAALTDKVQNALDEARMLMLGTQVLIGFDFRAAIEPGFEKLPPITQYLKLVSLGLLLVTLGLLLWPGAFHQQVERGEDTVRTHSFTTQVMCWALLPFAIGLGLDLWTPFDRELGTSTALLVGLVATAFALFCWYRLNWVTRHSPHVQDVKEAHAMSDEQAKGTPLDTRIRQVLTEARVVLPGAQALLGFQLVAVLADGFEKLPESSRQLHLVSLVLLALSTVLLMTPAAYHRVVEQGENTEHFHRFASRLVLTAMVPLALAIAGDAYIVVEKVTHSASLAVLTTLLLLVFFFGCWFGYTAYARHRRGQAQDERRAAASATGMPRML
jgi:Family of unknown function (DUF6328)